MVRVMVRFMVGVMVRFMVGVIVSAMIVRDLVSRRLTRRVDTTSDTAHPAGVKQRKFMMEIHDGDST